MGPIHKADSRQAVVARMLDLLDAAKAAACDLVIYPELTLTTFFPRWYMTDQAEVDAWFEREMPNAATRPLFERAAAYRIGLSFGYAELTPDGHHFNTSILVDRDGNIVGKYRNVHLQRPALAGDLSGDGAAGGRADRARLQHTLGQLAEIRRGAAEAPVPQP